MTLRSHDPTTPRPQHGHTTFIFVGHRGTGKSTLGQRIADRLDWTFIDLDNAITEKTGQTPSEIIADSEERFRDIERNTFDQLLDRNPNTCRIIAPGAGFHPLPDKGIYIWLTREGWIETAKHNRQRLRPQMPFTKEVEWMIQTREPRWERRAHLKFHVARGRTERRAARQLARQLRWLTRVGDSPLAQSSFVVPGSDDSVVRARRDAKRFGLGGVELRSDLLESPVGNLSDRVASECMASLRTDAPEWLLHADGADYFDIDLKHIDSVLEADTLETLSSRPLILSMHPAECGNSQFSALAEARQKVLQNHPDWADITLKLAPSIDNIDDIRRGLEWASSRRDEDIPATFMPQGYRFAWLRPVLLSRFNETNYLPVGLARRKRKHTAAEAAPVYDLSDWLPHFAGPVPDSFQALIGSPVDQSIGDQWHRAAALAGDGRSSYLKIPVSTDAPLGSVDNLLELLPRLSVTGLSVTSPLKTKILESKAIYNPERLSAANTLRFKGDGKHSSPMWRATDTDEHGMRAALAEIEDSGVGPGSIALIGRGGVSPAVVRAIESSDWELTVHASGREGWTDKAPAEVDLVVNAAGNSAGPYSDPPRATAWLDLHYSNVGKPPGCVEHHFIGDRFFEAQAQQQRQFWGESGG